MSSNDQSINQTNNQTINQTNDLMVNNNVVNHNNVLFRYPFLVPLVVLMLRDGDVLVGLLATTKTMKKLLKGYAVKGTIQQSSDTKSITAAELCKPDRYLPVEIMSLSEVTSFDFIYCESLTKAKLSRNKSEMPFGRMPDSLIELECGHDFNQAITCGMFPDQLKKLDFGIRFNQPIPSGALPESLQVLILSNCFDHSLEVDSLPSSLTDLLLGFRFDQPIRVDVLPMSLTSLTFSSYWNQPLEKGVLPPNLRKLHFGWKFNQFIDIGIISDSVTELTLDSDFDRPLMPGVIPPSVTWLNYKSESRQRFCDGSLPSNIKVLKIEHYFSEMLDMCILPASLKHLEITFVETGSQMVYFRTLPHGLQYLRIYGHFDQELIPGMLPSLKELHLDRYPCSIRKGCLPEQLTRFTCGSFHSSFTPSMFPPSLRRIDLSYCRHPLVSGAIPFGVTDLAIHSGFDQTYVSDTFPTSIKKLFLSGLSKVLPGSIPCSVTQLRLDCLTRVIKLKEAPHIGFEYDYDKRVRDGVIPSSVIHLEFGIHTAVHISTNTIPHSATHLVLSQYQQIDNSDIIPPSVICVECQYDQYNNSDGRCSLPSTVQEVFCSDLPALNHHFVTSDHVRISSGSMSLFDTSDKHLGI